MTIRARDGHQIAYDEFYASRSKPIIDDIDAVLAELLTSRPKSIPVTRVGLRIAGPGTGPRLRTNSEPSANAQ